MEFQLGSKSPAKLHNTRLRLIFFLHLYIAPAHYAHYAALYKEHERAHPAYKELFQIYFWEPCLLAFFMPELKAWL